jgi:hypothetical protein
MTVPGRIGNYLQTELAGAPFDSVGKVAADFCIDLPGFATRIRASVLHVIDIPVATDEKPGKLARTFLCILRLLSRAASRIALLCYLRLHHVGICGSPLALCIWAQRVIRMYAVIHYLCELVMATQ